MYPQIYRNHTNADISSKASSPPKDYIIQFGTLKLTANGLENPPIFLHFSFVINKTFSAKPSQVQNIRSAIASEVQISIQTVQTQAPGLGLLQANLVTIKKGRQAKHVQYCPNGYMYQQVDS